MARFAFAWELGGELGHATSCAALAATLALRGHRIAFFFRELRALAFLRGTEGYDVFQAPVMVEEAGPVPATYADILRGCGYGDPSHLHALASGWRTMLAAWRPDVLIDDSAPTALLAARTLGLRRVRYGNGFALPPLASPIPPFRFDQNVPLEHAMASEALALAAANEVLARFGAAPLARLADLLQADEQFLCTFPELDQYGVRGVAGYWGPRYQADAGRRVPWPRGGGGRVLVYVKPALRHIDALIAALAASPHRVVAFIPELDAARAARLAGPSRVVSTSEPIRLDALLPECDLLVSHGGNICPGTLTAGVPQLVFPTHYEQYLTARRVEQLGAGLWIAEDAGAADVVEALRRVLAEPRFTQAAKALHARYASFSPGEQRRRMAARLEQVAAS